MLLRYFLPGESNKEGRGRQLGGGFGVATPTSYRRGQRERTAKFGTVVETCFFRKCSYTCCACYPLAITVYPFIHERVNRYVGVFRIILAADQRQLPAKGALTHHRP